MVEINPYLTSFEDNLGVIADGDGLVGEVVGVDADAVAADQAGAEGQEVPFAAGGFRLLGSVQTRLGEVVIPGPGEVCAVAMNKGHLPGDRVQSGQQRWA